MKWNLLQYGIQCSTSWLRKKNEITCGSVPTGTVRGTPNLLVVDIPLTNCKHNVNATMIRKKLFEACMNASVVLLVLVRRKGTKSGMAVSGVLGRKSLWEFLSVDSSNSTKDGLRCDFLTTLFATNQLSANPLRTLQLMKIELVLVCDSRAVIGAANFSSYRHFFFHSFVPVATSTSIYRWLPYIIFFLVSCVCHVYMYVCTFVW